MKPVEDFLVKDIKWYRDRRAEKSLLISADVLAMTIAFCLAQVYVVLPASQSGFGAIGTWWGEYGLKRFGLYLLLTVAVIVRFGLEGAYSKRRPYFDQIREILKVCFVVGLVDAAMLYFQKWPFSRAAVLINWALAPCALLGARWAVRSLLLRVGAWIRPMVIVGWGNNAIETAKAFGDEKSMGFRLVAFLVPANKNRSSISYKDYHGHTIPCIQLGPDIAPILNALGNVHVVMATEPDGLDLLQPILQQLNRRNLDIQIVPSLRGFPVYGMQVNHFFRHEVLLLTIRNNLAQRGKLVLKRSFDIFASCCALVIGLPLLVGVALGVAASGRPIFFGHKRVGQHGKLFRCFKFRTMRPNSDELLRKLLSSDPSALAEWARDFKLKNDPRVTSLGRFLRKTSLDELPQLWNVLKGEMSLVGPRPIVEAELERYGDQVHYYLQTKPGITGLWQISGRSDTAYDARVNLDSWYVKNWSLFNDIAILAKTVKVILKKDGAY